VSRPSETKLAVVVIVVMIVIPVVMVAMVLVIPVSRMHLPSVLVVVVMRVAPVRPCIRRPPPHSRDPHIPVACPVPIAIDPNIARTWHGRRDVVP
jgi:hypothetical protein